MNSFFLDTLILAAEPIFPYLHAGPWKFGPFTVHMFGLMVGLGIITGTYVIQNRGFKIGLNTLYTSEVVMYGMIGLFVGAHLFEIIAYQPARILKDPLVLLRIWDGISSFGGLIGVTIAIFIYTKIKKIDVWSYFDIVVWGSIHAWIFGRMGCSFAHDHPGRFTDSWFSVKWPVNHFDQVWNVNNYAGRHDLGLYELIFTFFLLAIIYATNWKGQRFRGFTVALLFVMYAPVRFMMDFLRTADKMYMGFTPAQYMAVIMFLSGIAMFIFLPEISKRNQAKHKKAIKSSSKEISENIE
jgi:phosphatidylglycerol---prolipoprotein diacylglyceryl transferase